MGEYLLLFFVILTMTSLGYLVYRQSPKNISTHYYVCLLSTIVLWVLCNFFEGEVNSPFILLTLFRLDFAVAACHFYYFFMFCLVFPVRSIHNFKPLWMAIPMSGIALLSLTPLIVKDVVQYGVGIQPGFTTGPLFSLFVILVAACYLPGIYFLYKKTHQLTGLGRTQVAYVLLGVLISGGVPVIINLGLAPFFPITESISRFGIYSLLALAAFPAYAMVRYRLMDTRLLIKETSRYFFMAGLLSFTLALLIGVLTNDKKATVLAFLFSLAIPFLYKRLHEWLEAIGSRSGLLDSNQARKITSVADRIKGAGYKTSDLAETVTQMILNDLPVAMCGMYVWDGEKSVFTIEGQIGMDGQFVHSLPAKDPLIRFLEENKDTDVLVKSEAERFLPAETFNSLLPSFNSLQAEVCAPLIVLDRIAGLIALGPKTDKKPFFTNDIRIVSQIATETATALRYVLAVSQAAVETKRWAHSLNQSLKPLVQGFDVLRDVDGSIEADPNKLEIYNRMKRPLKRLGDFLYYLTHQARMVDETLRNHYARTEVKLGDIIGRAVQNSKTSIEKKNVQWTLQITPPDAMVLGHERDLVSLFECLMNNALRYVPPEKSIRARCYVVGDKMRVFFENEGPAIPEKHLEDIFIEGFQIKDGREGTGGLGLANVKRIAGLHEGKVHAENWSDGGKSGVRFIFDLSLPQSGG